MHSGVSLIRTCTNPDILVIRGKIKNINDTLVSFKLNILIVSLGLNDKRRFNVEHKKSVLINI